MHGGEEKCIKYCGVKILKERNLFEALGSDGVILLKSVLKNLDWRVYNGFIWTSHRFL
jgi:hypothetical protein